MRVLPAVVYAGASRSIRCVARGADGVRHAAGVPRCVAARRGLRQITPLAEGRRGITPPAGESRHYPFGEIVEADAAPSGPLRASAGLPRLTLNLAIHSYVFMEMMALAALDESEMTPEARARREKAAAKRARKKRP